MFGKHNGKLYMEHGEVSLQIEVLNYLHRLYSLHHWYQVFQAETLKQRIHSGDAADNRTNRIIKYIMAG